MNFYIHLSHSGCKGKKNYLNKMVWRINLLRINKKTILLHRIYIIQAHGLLPINAPLSEKERQT